MFNKQICMLCMMLAMAGATGCSLFVSPMEKPIIEDHSRGITTFATIPSRRMVILSPHDRNIKNSPKEVFICAEPSPDVSDNIASSLTAALSGKGLSAGNVSASDITADIFRTLETTAQNLFKRSQGVQLYRDGMYNLCQARMNGIIDDAAFMTKAEELLKSSVELVRQEIPYLYQKQHSAEENSESGNKKPDKK